MEIIESQVSAPAAPVESAPTQDAPITDAPASGEGTDDAAPKAEPPKPEAPTRLQKRIDDLTRQRYEEQRARESAEARLAQYERQQAQAQQFAQIDAQAPRIDQFNDLATYQMAMSNWTAQRSAAIATAQWEERMQQMAQHQARQAQEQFQHQQRITQENVVLDSKMASAAKKYPDFMQVVTSQDIASVRNTPLFSLILEADNAGDIAYALAKNPTEIDRLLSLGHPAAMARAVFALDRQFSGNAVTTAPPPPPSRNGSTAPSGQPDPKDTEAWMKWREADLKAKGRSR